MFSFLQRLFGRTRTAKPDLHMERASEDVQVLVPEAVELPLPKGPQEEISVPASINGRDLSSGRL